MSLPAENLPAPSGPSDAALVVSARAGEGWACEVLYRRHARGIFGLAIRLLGQDADIDDLVQESFVLAFEGLDRLKEPAAFRSWVAGILVRRASKLLRHRKLLRRLGLRHPEPPADFDKFIARSAPPEVVAELRAIYQAIDRMPADIRTALILRKVEGHTLPEIAKLSDMSLATVKRKLQRGEALLAKLKGEGS